MYPVSDEFLKKIQDKSRSFHYAGKIVTRYGTEYEFEAKDIVKGSAYVTNQCCGSNELELGCVYAAEVGISLYSDIDRYTLADGQLYLNFYLQLENGKYEEVPLGIFDISEATRNYKTLTIKGYDKMLRFDEAFNLTSLEGNAYHLLSLACLNCDMEMVHTEKEIESWINGTENLSLYTDHDVSTWRDVLFFVAQSVCRFCTITRDGKLELRSYGTEPVMVIPSTQRYKSNYSDFVTKYTAVSVTNMRTQMAEYYAKDTDDGLTMNLGSNPFMQYTLEDTRNRVFQAIISGLENINYVPFETTTIGNPAFDLGDVIIFSGGHADSEQITCIMSYHLAVNGKQTLKCVGKNPKLAGVKSKNDKNISALISQVSMEKNIIYSYMNAETYDIGLDEEEIISIAFASISDTDAQFFASILIDVEVPEEERNSKILYGGTSYDVVQQFPGKTNVTITYVLNGNRVNSHIPIESLHSGRHILTLYFPINGIEGNSFYTFKVLMNTDGGSVAIDMAGIRATVVGQGLSATEAGWDGTINAKDDITTMPLQTINTGKVNDFVWVTEVPRESREMMTEVSAVPVRGRLSVGFVESSVVFGYIIHSVSRDSAVLEHWSYDIDYVNTAAGIFAMKNSYTYGFKEMEIDNGKMYVVELPAETFSSISSVEVS